MIAEERLFHCHFVRHISYKLAPGVEPKLTACEGRNMLGFLNFSKNHSRLTPSTVYLHIHLLTVILIWLPDRDQLPSYAAKHPRRALLSLGSTGATLMFKLCRAKIQIFLRTQEQIYKQINLRWANLMPYCNSAGPDWNVACFLQIVRRSLCDALETCLALPL